MNANTCESENQVLKFVFIRGIRGQSFSLAAHHYCSAILLPETAMPFKRPKKTYDENTLYDYAVGALGRRMRSVAELKRLMRTRCPEEAIVDKVILRLKDQKYLNDTSYAASYTAYRRDNEKFGRRRVMTDLKVKGVHGDVIEKAIDEAYSAVNEEELARAFLRRKRLKKPEDQKQTARIFRALMRAGFSPGIAIKILKNWNVEDEVLTALQEEEIAE
jgi:regulatory protein